MHLQPASLVRYTLRYVFSVVIVVVILFCALEQIEWSQLITIWTPNVMSNKQCTILMIGHIIIIIIIRCPYVVSYRPYLTRSIDRVLWSVPRVSICVIGILYHHWSAALPHPSTQRWRPIREDWMLIKLIASLFRLTTVRFCELTLIRRSN